MGAAILNQDQLEHYAREGYVLARGLVPNGACATAVAAIERRHAANTFAIPNPDGTRDSKAKEWTPINFNRDDPSQDADVHGVLVQAPVMDVVEQLLCGAARVWHGMAATVPANGGRGLPWHHDNMYTWIHGPALNVFIALADIAPEQAMLWVAPRSHYGEIQRGTPAEGFHGHPHAQREPDNGMPLPAMKAGDACIFTRCTLHRSLTNQTSRPRHGYGAQFISASARDTKDGKPFPNRWLVRELAAQWGSKPLRAAI